MAFLAISSRHACNVLESQRRRNSSTRRSACPLWCRDAPLGKVLVKRALKRRMSARCPVASGIPLSGMKLGGGESTESLSFMSESLKGLAIRQPSSKSIEWALVARVHTSSSQSGRRDNVFSSALVNFKSSLSQTA